MSPDACSVLEKTPEACFRAPAIVPNSAAKTMVPSDSRANLMDQAACAALTARVDGTTCATGAFRIARTADPVVQVQALNLTCEKLNDTCTRLEGKFTNSVDFRG